LLSDELVDDRSRLAFERSLRRLCRIGLVCKARGELGLCELLPSMFLDLAAGVARELVLALRNTPGGFELEDKKKPRGDEIRKK
jgi:hypothetical protein